MQLLGSSFIPSPLRSIPRMYTPLCYKLFNLPSHIFLILGSQISPSVCCIAAAGPVSHNMVHVGRCFRHRGDPSHRSIGVTSVERTCWVLCCMLGEVHMFQCHCSPIPSAQLCDSTLNQQSVWSDIFPQSCNGNTRIPPCVIWIRSLSQIVITGVLMELNLKEHFDLQGELWARWKGIGWLEDLCTGFILFLLKSNANMKSAPSSSHSWNAPCLHPREYCWWNQLCLDILLRFWITLDLAQCSSSMAMLLYACFVSLHFV